MKSVYISVIEVMKMVSIYQKESGEVIVEIGGQVFTAKDGTEALEIIRRYINDLYGN